MPSSKKQKKLDKIGDDVRYVLLVPYDDPFGYVRADRKVLDEFDCATAKKIRHDPPCRWNEGMPVYTIEYKRPMIIELIKCLTMQEFIVSKDVTYAEAVAVLKREGIGCPGNEEIKEPKLKQTLLHPLSQPACTFHAEEPSAENVVRICTLVANAIVEWPRPRIMLTDNLAGRDSGHSSSSSRFWVRFAKQPHIEKYGGDELYALAKKRPKWLERTLKAIGFVHCDMVRSGELDRSLRDPVSFSKLADHIREKDTTRYYISVKRDMPQHHRELNNDVIRHADRWAAWVLSTVDAHGSAHDLVTLSPADERKVRRGGGDGSTQYARAAVALAEDEFKKTPNCYRMFSGECGDDDKRGNTPERTVLAKALKQRGARVVRWKDGDGEALQNKEVINPVIFPPSFFSHLASDGPCVLIEMELGK